MKLSLTLIISLLLFWGCSSSKKPQMTETTVATGNVNRPTIAIDSTNGTVYVAWIGRTDTVSNVYLSSLKPGNTKFSYSVRVNTIRGNATMVSQSPPQVTVSPAGLVYVTWLDQTEIKGRRWPDLNIYVARLEDEGRTFSPGVLVDNPRYPDSQGFYDIVVGPEGNVYVSWLGSGVENSDSKMDMNMNHQYKTADNHEGMHMEGSGARQIYVARSVNHARSFEPKKMIAKHTCQCCRTAITVGDNGDVYAAWRQIFGDNIRDIAMARSTNAGNSFSDLIRVHKDGWHINGCPHDGPSIVVNGKKVFVIWFTGAKGKAGVYVANASESNLKFGKPILLSRSKGTAQVEADVSPNGDFWFVWENPAKDSIRIGSYIDGSLNKSFAVINHGRLPSIAATNKKVAVTYLDGDSVKVRVYRLKGL